MTSSAWAGTAGAAPQAMLLVAGGEDLQFRCTGVECLAEATSICLQAERATPRAKTPYELVDEERYGTGRANGLQLVGITAAGEEKTLPLETMRIIAEREHMAVRFIVDKAVFRTENGTGPGYFITVIVAQLVLGILASMIVMYFSRLREFRADRGGARLAGRNSMIGALEALRRQHEPRDMPPAMKAFGIAGGNTGGFKRLFMSHPPLEERIAALQNAD